MKLHTTIISGETWASTLGNGAWNDALHDGAFEADPPAGITALSGNTAASASTPSTGLVLEEGGLSWSCIHQPVWVTASRQINPWLQEFPDPITRTSCHPPLSCKQHFPYHLHHQRQLHLYHKPENKQSGILHPQLPGLHAWHQEWFSGLF